MDNHSVALVFFAILGYLFIEEFIGNLLGH
jgi:hypothetical protein